MPQPHQQPTPERREYEHEEELPELFDPNTAANFQDEWRNIQASFVDDPRSAVADANALVDQVIRRIVDSFDRARHSLESQWDVEGQVSTEELRRALMRYRSFFHRLLSAYNPQF